VSDWFKNYVDEYARVVQSLPLNEVKAAAQLIAKARDEGRTIFVCGNGGSAATASHFATDMGKGASLGQPKRLRIMSLSDNTPWLTALANDVSYDDVFVEQMKNFAQPNDILIAISVSGNSPTVVKAAQWAHDNGIATIGLACRRRGKLAELADYPLLVDDDHFGRVEDAHMQICHLIAYSLIEQAV
jgi:D-sedoheptulose 7-phosphate isomerase